MNFVTVGALFGALGVALGAFGAHGLSKIASPDKLSLWETASRYQLITALALILFGLLRRLSPGSSSAGLALVAGIVLFSGSLYAMALGAPRWLGAITPLGGLCMITGWVLIAVAAR